ncbi:MAG TPA: CHAT domain-containing protein [Thermoanaerobaculia bacterium]
MTRRLGCLLGLAGVLLACGSRSKPAVPLPPAPEVEYDGCWAVYLPGPVCALKSDRKLSLWVKDESDLKVEIRTGDQLQKIDGQEVGGGRRFALSLPPQPSSLTVRLCPSDGACGPPWSLSLSPPEEPKWFARLGKVRSAEDRHELQQYLEGLRKGAPAKEQGIILRTLAMLAGQDGDLKREAADLEQGTVADRAVSNLKGGVEKVTFLAKLDIAQSRFSQARHRLEDLRLPPAAPAITKYQVAYYMGLLSERVGDYRSALEKLRQAADVAERTGLAVRRWEAEQLLAISLQEVGRSQEASELFARLDAKRDLDSYQPCQLGSFLTNEGWSRLVAREAGETTEDPIPILKGAQSEYDKHQCKPEQRLNALLNLALADLQAGRASEAGHALDGARALVSDATPHDRLWWLDLEARAVMDRQPARALALYDELAGEAQRTLSLEGRFRAAVGRARAHRALRRPAAALADFAEADRLIDEQSSHVAVHEGRDTLVGQRQTATREYLELLLAEGQRRRAFELVRRDRSRLLYQLAIRDRLTRLKPAEQQAWDRALSAYRTVRNSIDQEAARQWQLPTDQIGRAQERRAAQLARAQQNLDHAVAGLGDFGDQGARGFSPPGEDEVILAYHPLPKGWARFAAHGESLEIGRFELPAHLPAGPELAGLLLAPFQNTIQQAGRVRVLPYGSLQAVDFHALPVDGEPLFAHHLVVYSLDLPARPSPPAPGRPVALLVSNPQSDQGYLPAAEREVNDVAADIGKWAGWTLTRLPGKAASFAAVSSALPGADLFHFAGHGNFAGFAGWDSAIPLADGSRLTLGDILTLPKVPRWVVLSACDAGRSSREAPGEGIGLAHAFLLAGSQAVIAATRTVDDETARHLLGALYRDWTPGTDLARQLQRAELACRRQNPQADCASFRLIEP